MSTIKTTDEELMAMDISYTDLTARFIQEGFSPYACAASMVKIAFMIYKTSLDAEEYNLMIDSISDSRDKIKSITDLQKLSRLN